MNKKQLHARAHELGVTFVSRDSVETLRSKIEKAEQAKAKPKAPRATKAKAAGR